MKLSERTVAVCCMVLALAMNVVGATRLSSDSLKGQRLKSGDTTPEKRIDYDMKKSNGGRGAANDSEEGAAAGVRRGGRSSRRLNIRTFCGRKFGEKAPLGRTECSAQSEKPYFRFYAKLKLKYSPFGGLYSITVLNDDPYTIRDVEAEMRRVMRELEQRYDFRFSGEIERSDNGVKVETKPAKNNSTGNAEMDEAFAKISEMLAGLQAGAAKPRPATRWESRITQEFANFRFSLLGIRDDEKKTKSVEVTLERFMD